MVFSRIFYKLREPFSVFLPTKSKRSHYRILRSIRIRQILLYCIPMREAVFLKQNQQKWQELEQQLGNPRASADELAELYIKVTDDLAYARTFYPESKSYSYLNGLAVKIHSKVYRNKKERVSRMISFWTHELPGVLFRHRHKILFSFVVFVLGTCIGMISAANDNQFVRLILGDGYVDMTIDNIKEGKPLDVYGRSPRTDMFVYIAFNNIMVSFFQFVWGITAGVYTLMNELQNAIMLGAFQYFFYQYNELTTSLLTIWIHGTLEISAIIIACAAGFAFGGGLLFPGTYKRKESFLMGVKDGVRMIIGLIPVFIIAAFFESFVTRHYQALGYGSLLIIGPSLVFVIWYFVVYPLKFRNGNRG
jgi:uncharacterized membrane protein SpoIIM required for sporulation